jgi:uncharacterized protein with NAD-binding domain and iron-sulfur cluster
LVLGGGCGGVAAAWALTRTPELRRRHQVTVVQAGWRLGGKGATGRCPERHHAILEHGLHLWLGFYRCAFAMVRDLYEAWDRPTSGPQRSLEAAFSPLYDVALRGAWEGESETWRMRFPRRGSPPWLDARPLDLPAALAAFAADVPRMLVSTDDSRWDRRRIACLARLASVVVLGLARERARHGDDMWDRMDEQDLRAWLREHGASNAEATSPPIGALYDLGFAYPDGIVGSDCGAIAAGAGLRVLLRIFGAYRGAPFYRMNAGMGDTVFAPAWDVLRARGVRFRLFHRVERLGVHEDAIGTVELAVQARATDEYDPLIRVGAIRAWPDRPRREQLETIISGDLEADDGDAVAHIELARGRDFDDVILAIPATGQRRIASELMDASPRYRAMVEHTHAVPTVAAQWWLTRSPTLGSGARVLTGMPGLFRTWADLSEVVDAEAWPERPQGLAYLCNVAPRELFATHDRERASAFVADQMQAWASGALLDVWNSACGADGRFDESLLACAQGASRWSTAYARANVAAWERYVLTLPGTTRYRLAPGDSGFANLFLAGDWTRSIINGGSVEGAVSSGIAAAEAISAQTRER